LFVSTTPLHNSLKTNVMDVFNTPYQAHPLMLSIGVYKYHDWEERLASITLISNMYTKLLWRNET
jgi:hypothetical protein